MPKEPDNQNLTGERPSFRIRPEHLQAKYKIGKSTYYKRTRYLDIQTQKDEDKKVYLTHEQVAELDRLHSYIQTHGTMIGFKTSQRVDKNLHLSSMVASADEELQQAKSVSFSNFPKAPGPTTLIL